MILNDKDIKNHVLLLDMIKPFAGSLETNGVVSYGLSSYGYDIRLADEFKLFANTGGVIDPKNITDDIEHISATYIDVPPGDFVLGRSLEYIKMPDDVFGLVLGKSTYARCGLSCLATPLEPGWEGHITLEFSNTTRHYIRLYADEGCAQIVFFRGHKPSTTYRDRGGKYQCQTGVTLPRI